MTTDRKLLLTKLIVSVSEAITNKDTALSLGLLSRINEIIWEDEQEQLQK